MEYTGKDMQVAYPIPFWFRFRIVLSFELWLILVPSLTCLIVYLLQLGGMYKTRNGTEWNGTAEPSYALRMRINHLIELVLDLTTWIWKKL